MSKTVKAIADHVLGPGLAHKVGGALQDLAAKYALHHSNSADQLAPPTNVMDLPKVPPTNVEDLPKADPHGNVPNNVVNDHTAPVHSFFEVTGNTISGAKAAFEKNDGIFSAKTAAFQDHDGVFAPHLQPTTDHAHGDAAVTKAADTHMSVVNPHDLATAKAVGIEIV